MSIFGDLDVDNIADDPFQVSDGTHLATITSCKVGKTQNGDKTGMTIEYTITDEDDADNGKKVTEWKQIPTPSDPHNLTAEELRSASFLKRRLLDFGIPADRLGTVEPDDLIHTDVVITVKKKGDYTNVTKVMLPREANVGGGFGDFGSPSFSG